MSDQVTIQPHDFDAVIFDMDGVVTDTAVVHSASWKRLFDDYLRQRAEREGGSWEPFEDEDYRRYVDGKPRSDGVEAFLASRGVTLPRGEPDDPPDADTVVGLGSRKNGYFLKQLEEEGAVAYPTTVELIRSLKERGLRIALFSASKNAKPVLEAAGVIDLFEARVDGHEAERLGLPGKPEPDVLIEAARRLDAKPNRTAVAEDALAGVQAGRAGGFKLVIGVNRSEQPGELLANGADVEVPDLGDVRVADN